MSVIPVSIVLSVPLIVLPVHAHPLVTLSPFVSLLFTVLLRVALVIVHVIPISVALTATVPISSQIHSRVLVKARNGRLCSGKNKHQGEQQRNYNKDLIIKKEM